MLKEFEIESTTFPDRIGIWVTKNKTVKLDKEEKLFQPHQRKEIIENSKISLITIISDLYIILLINLICLL